eukprot:GEMP01003152.1.p1 GENE.GEMP01003152.1~~GEMP01003152.1.p1  ORF type:complete len:945 (+),score=117.55 GEMP01003152.1:83-2917(+)
MAYSKPQRHLYDAIVRHCRVVVENRWFTAWCTILTLYALFGDDIRLAGTDRAQDDIFDVLTIICLVTFFIEVVIASIGKDEYFMSFFFVLDTMATASLIVDITPVSEALFNHQEQGMGESGNVPRSVKASQAARASRVVRIIRLIRIVKLYKAAVEARARRERQRQKKQTDQPTNQREYDDDDAGSDDWDEDDMKDETPAASEGTQTRVGKKLTDMTTRRVIILVLLMLFVVPNLQYDSWSVIKTHGTNQFGADSLMLDYLEMRKIQAAGVNTSAYRLAYELALLQYVYHHNWHARAAPAKCVDQCTGPWDYLSHVLWIGINSVDVPAEVRITQYNDPSQWDAWFNGSPDGPLKSNFTSGNLPNKVKQRFLSPWEDECRDWKDWRGIQIADTPCSALRYTEFEMTWPFFSDSDTTADQQAGFVFVFIFDIRPSTRLEAVLNMCQTCFICFVLTLGAMLISQDTNRLVLVPIEMMIEKMHRIRDNPLTAMRLGDEEYKKSEAERRRTGTRVTKSQLGTQSEIIREAFAKHAHRWYWRFYLLWLTYQMRKQRKKSEEITEEPMETIILEKTIIKLGSLLALGFGEAGANIIGQNMSGSDAGVNALIPGKRVEAIFGFCDIRNFNDCTEILQDKVMVFVNQIGEIVHSIVDMYNGVANKNIGDAFLLVWRVRAMDEEPDNFRLTRMCDMSVLSFVKIVAAINMSFILAQYREHPGLLARLPHYRVRMGFGLHMGSAIEGAIGSDFKIDASYLSPNVNTAARLEAATKQFGCSILISGTLMDGCSKRMRNQCRRVDHVMVKGSKVSIVIFTIDLDYLCLELEVGFTAITKITRRLKYEVRQVRDIARARKWGDGYSVVSEFEEDPSIVQMRMIFTDDFVQRFSMGFRNYEAGQWEVARDVLEHTRFMLTLPSGHHIEDVPSTTLLTYMKSFDYKAPNDWRGHRCLTEK